MRTKNWASTPGTDRTAAHKPMQCNAAHPELVSATDGGGALALVSLFVAGEGLSAGDVFKTNGAVINAAAARSPVLAQGGVE